MSTPRHVCQNDKASRYNIASFGSVFLNDPLGTHPSLTDTRYIVPIYVSCVHVVGTIHRRCFERTSVFYVVDACLTSLSSESHVPAISEQSCIMRPKFLRLNRKHISLDMINPKSVSLELSIIRIAAALQFLFTHARRSEQL